MGARRAGLELSARSEEFRDRWARHDVRFHFSGVKRLRHPQVGETIVSRARVASDTNRRGMRLVSFETETTDQKGSPVCRSRALFVIRS